MQEALDADTIDPITDLVNGFAQLSSGFPGVDHRSQIILGISSPFASLVFRFRIRVSDGGAGTGEVDRHGRLSVGRGPRQVHKEIFKVARHQVPCRFHGMSRNSAYVNGMFVRLSSKFSKPSDRRINVGNSSLSNS